MAESSATDYNYYISASPINHAQLWPAFLPARDSAGGYYQYSSSTASPGYNPLAYVQNVTNAERNPHSRQRQRRVQDHR